MVERVWRSSNERSCGPDVQVTSPTDQPWPAATLRPTARPASPRSLRRFSASCTATAIFHKAYLRLRSTISVLTAETIVLRGDDCSDVNAQRLTSWSKYHSTLDSKTQRLSELVAATECGTFTPEMAAPDRVSLTLGITCHGNNHAG